MTSPELNENELEPSIAVFVYGTLLQYESNYFLLAESEFLGADQLGGAQMFNLGDYPMIIPSKGLVKGEVYRVTATVLAQLDKLEEHPNYYQRGLVTLQSGRSAFVYWGSRKFTDGHPAIQSGSWRAR